MKIFCVARNYGEHVKELNNAMPENPVVFMKPATAILQKNQPFYLPSFSNDMHYETEIVLKVAKNGKHIEEKFALSYISEVTVGIDFTARDIQAELKKKGLPWEIAKAFDKSAVIGKFIPYSDVKNIHDVNFCLYMNKKLTQKGNTSNMIYSIETLICFISKYFTIQKGDLIYTGTPVGVGAVKQGDHLEAFIENESLLEFDIK